MNVGDLKRALAHYSDDTPVVVAPKGWTTRHDWISTHSGTGVSNREDTDVAAFVIDIGMTLIKMDSTPAMDPATIQTGIMGAELLADDPHAPAPGTASAFRRAAEPMPSSYGNPRNVSLDQGYGGVYRQQRQAEADIKREASSYRLPRQGMRCGCFSPHVIDDSRCQRCGGWTEEI
jgi:hypothetical protein